MSFGADISCFPDLDPLGKVQTGVRVLAEAIVRRLSTPVLFYAPGYGIDLRSYLLAGLTDSDLYKVKAAIEGQCLKDERVTAARAGVALDSTGTLTATITITPSNGTPPFTMIVSASSLNVKLIGTKQ